MLDALRERFAAEPLAAALAAQFRASVVDAAVQRLRLFAPLMAVVHLGHVIAFRAATRSMPFIATGRRGIQGPAEEALVRSRAPRTLADALVKCLQVDPDRRPSAGELEKQLRAIADAEGAPPLETIAMTPPHDTPPPSAAREESASLSSIIRKLEALPDVKRGEEQIAATVSNRRPQKRLARYALEEQHGDFWRAHDERLDRPVTLQIIKGVEKKDEIVERMREAAQVWHPSLTAILDVDDTGLDVAIVFEPIEGAPLDALADADAIKRALREIASALSALGERQLVHGAVTTARLHRGVAKLPPIAAVAPAKDDVDAFRRLVEQLTARAIEGKTIDDIVREV